MGNKKMLFLFALTLPVSIYLSMKQAQRCYNSLSFRAVPSCKWSDRYMAGICVCVYVCVFLFHCLTILYFIWRDWRSLLKRNFFLFIFFISSFVVIAVCVCASGNQRQSHRSIMTHAARKCLIGSLSHKITVISQSEFEFNVWNTNEQPHTQRKVCECVL